MRNNIVKCKVKAGIWKLQGIRTGLERERCALNLRGKGTQTYLILLKCSECKGEEKNLCVVNVSV